MDDEVLVHISAPATRQNDELFRSLAHAYVDFEPHQIHSSIAAQQRAILQEPHSKSSLKAKASAIAETIDPSASAVSKESYGSFPSNISAGETFLIQYESTRPFSRLAQLDRSYLSWRQHATSKSGSARSQTKLRTSSDGPDADTGFIEDSQTALQALQSQLQDVYSTTSTDTSGDENSEDENRPYKETQPPSMLNFNAVPSSRTAEELLVTSPLQRPTRCEQRPDRVGASIALTKQTNQEPQNSQRSVKSRGGELQEPADLSSQADSATSSDAKAFQGQTDYSVLSTAAFPPPPTITIACPGALPSQITTYLGAIKTKNPTRFRPFKIRRDLENDERGFWSIECERWTSNVQRDFWMLLSEHVRSGRMGWGITLHRDSDSRYQFGTIRIYCWGEIVEHVWLLLWLCSKGKLFRLESQWIDADGVAVVEMK